MIRLLFYHFFNIQIFCYIYGPCGIIGKIQKLIKASPYFWIGSLNKNTKEYSLAAFPGCSLKPSWWEAQRPVHLVQNCTTDRLLLLPSGLLLPLRVAYILYKMYGRKVSTPDPEKSEETKKSN